MNHNWFSNNFSVDLNGLVQRKEEFQVVFTHKNLDFSVNSNKMTLITADGFGFFHQSVASLFWQQEKICKHVHNSVMAYICGLAACTWLFWKFLEFERFLTKGIQWNPIPTILENHLHSWEIFSIRINCVFKWKKWRKQILHCIHRPGWGFIILKRAEKFLKFQVQSKKR